jgi:hypothetical protein
VPLSSRELGLFATAHKGNPIIRNVAMQPAGKQGSRENKCLSNIQKDED